MRRTKLAAGVLATTAALVAATAPSAGAAKGIAVCHENEFCIERTELPKEVAEPLAGLALDAVSTYRQQCVRSRTKPIVIPGVARLLDCPPGPDKTLTLIRLDDNWPLPVTAVACYLREDGRWCVIRPGTGFGPVVPPDVEIYDIPGSP